MLGLGARRLYSTRPPLRPNAFAARTASTPLAVRLRREKKLGPVKSGNTDATPEGLTPTELARYKRLRAKSRLPIVSNREVSMKEWVDKVNKRRSRIRGFRTVKRDGKNEVEVVGQTVYLPNIIFKLVRNATPPGRPYNPYEATFYIPLSVTKTDIRSYLLAVYGVKTTYIRTDIYYPSPKGPISTRQRRSYKRAVVGLEDPFYYPQRMEDMRVDERAEREQWIQDHFRIKEARDQLTYQLLRISKQSKNVGLSFQSHNRAAILRSIADKRKIREETIAGKVGEWRQMREKGEHITIKKPRLAPRQPPSRDSSSESTAVST